MQHAARDIHPYRPLLERWLPNAEIRTDVLPNREAVPDALITWRAAGRTIRYLVEEKHHLRHQDVAVVVAQMQRLRAALPRAYANDRLLLLAPYIRRQQAAVLERAPVDYLDLAGNAHLEFPGLFVHVEGRKPDNERTAAPRRPHKGWIKTVMAILVQPALANAPYRVLAVHAGVALGTIAGCMHDLAARGLLLTRKGGRRVTDREALMALWVQAYIDGLRPRLTQRRLQVRAQAKAELRTRLQTVLTKQGHRWAVTGADAAEQRTHYFRAEETEIYAPTNAFDDRATQRALVAQPTLRGGNLLVIEPPGPLATPDRTVDAVPAAPDILVYAELRYRGTEQALEAAELLFRKVLANGPR